MSITPEPPNAGQESVWDYPRPPRLEECSAQIRVVAGGIIIAESSHSHRVLETSHPPVYYLPPKDIDSEYLQPSPRRSFCEWKGTASYYSVILSDRIIEKAAWCYNHPTPRFTAIKGHVAFYPSKMDACFVNDELVTAQEGDFYGGWITPNIIGPFKGAPETFGW